MAAATKLLSVVSTNGVSHNRARPNTGSVSTCVCVYVLHISFRNIRSVILPLLLQLLLSLLLMLFCLCGYSDTVSCFFFIFAC
jgi:hypothetical protein